MLENVLNEMLRGSTLSGGNARPGQNMQQESLSQLNAQYESTLLAIENADNDEERKQLEEQLSNIHGMSAALLENELKGSFSDEQARLGTDLAQLQREIDQFNEKTTVLDSTESSKNRSTPVVRTNSSHSQQLQQKEAYLAGTLDDQKGVEQERIASRLKNIRQEIEQLSQLSVINANSPDIELADSEILQISQSSANAANLNEIIPIANQLCASFYNKLVPGLKKGPDPVERAIQQVDSQLYIEPYVIDAGDKSQAFALDSINKFIGDPKQLSLVITADSGIGKTLCSQQIAHQQWKKYRSQHCDHKQLVFPIWLSIAAIPEEHREKDLLEQELKNREIPDYHIETLKCACQNGGVIIIVLIDGWDEIVPGIEENIYLKNQWWDPEGWPNIKVIATSRPEAFIQHKRDFRSLFHASNGQAKVISLQPFSHEQIESYLKLFVKSKSTHEIDESLISSTGPQVEDDSKHDEKASMDDWQQWTTYNRHLQEIPGLVALAQTPYILQIIVHALPEIVLDLKERPVAERQQYKEFQVFEKFVAAWHARKATDLWNNNENNLNLRCFDSKAQLQSCLLTYSKNLAMLAFNLGQGKFDVNSILTDKITLRFELIMPRDNSDPYVKPPKSKKSRGDLLKLIRSGSILSTKSGAFKFRHKSLIIHLATRGFAAAFLDFDAYLRGLPLSQIKSFASINEELLSQEPEAIATLAEQAQCDLQFKHLLYQIIESSKKEPLVAKASANAIMILNAAGETFSNLDFRDIRIPGAILIQPFFDSTDLSGADLRNVYMLSPWINNTNFTEAYLQNLHLMELPCIQHNELIVSIAIDPNTKWVIIGDAKGNLVKYDIVTGQILWKQQVTVEGYSYQILKYLTPFVGAITKVAVSSCGRWVAAITLNQRSIQLFDIAREQFAKSIVPENSKGMMLTSILFSPGGEMLLLHYKRSKLPENITNTMLPSLGIHNNQNNNTMLCMLSIPHGDLLNLIDDAGEKFAISPDGKWLVTNRNDGARDLALLNLEQAKRYLLQVDISISNDSAQVNLSRSGELEFGLGGLDTGQKKTFTEILSDPYFTNKIIDKSKIIFNRNGSILAISSGRQIRLLNTYNWRCIKAAAINGNLIGFSANGQLIISASPGSIHVYHTESMDYLYNIIIPAFDQTMQSLAISPDINQPHVYQVDRETIRVWPIVQDMPPHVKHQQLPVLRGTAQPGSYGKISANNSRILQIIKDNLSIKVAVEQLETTRLIVIKNENKKLFYFKPSRLIFLPNISMMVKLTLLLSPTKRYVAFACTSNPNAPLSATSQIGRLGGLIDKILSGCRAVRIWDLEEMKELCTIDPQKLISSMMFTQQDEWLVTAAHKVQIWSLQTGRSLYEFAAHKYGVGAIAMSADNKLLASFEHRSNTLRIWDVRQDHFWEGQEARCLYILRSMPDRILHMDFSTDDQYLLCDVSKGGRLTFEIKRNGNEVQLMIVNCTVELNLMAAGAQINAAIGLSDKNSRLLRQRGAIGKPVTKVNVEAMAKFGLMKSEDVADLNEKALNFSKAVIRGSTFSVLDPSLLIHYNQWVVSLVRNENSDAPRHAFIVIEGVNAIAGYICMRADLTNRGVSNGKARVKIEDSNKNNPISTKDKTRQKKEMLKLFKGGLGQFQREIKGIFGFSWLLSRQKALVMREKIKEDEKHGIREFSAFGARSILNKNSADNCFTWSRKKLLALGEPEITRMLPKTLEEYLATHPFYKLHTSPDGIDHLSRLRL